MCPYRAGRILLTHASIEARRSNVADRRRSNVRKIGEIVPGVKAGSLGCGFEWMSGSQALQIAGILANDPTFFSDMPGMQDSEIDTRLDELASPPCEKRRPLYLTGRLRFGEVPVAVQYFGAGTIPAIHDSYRTRSQALRYKRYRAQPFCSQASR
jgi:hypothetical protein